MKIVVLKIGGKEMDKDDERDMFITCVKEIVNRGFHCAVVHGGGNFIDMRLKEKNIQPKYIDGVRVTDEETMKIVEKVLCVEVQEGFFRIFLKKGIVAAPFSSLMYAKKTSQRELGLVGEITRFDLSELKSSLETNFVALIAPIAKDENTGSSLNVNADVCASRLAAEMRAEVLALITDVPGIYDEKKNVISSLTVKEAKKLMRSPVIQSGMLPKLSSCAEAVEGGVKRAYILDSKTLSAKLNDVLSGKPCGTMIYAGK